MALKLRVKENKVLFRVSSDKFSLSATEGVPIYPETYTGQTEVTPSEETQTLPTSGLMMIDDVTVLPIPYPDGNDLAYGNSSCLVGEAKVGTAYVWTDYDGDNIAIINKAVVGTSAVV